MNKTLLNYIIDAGLAVTFLSVSLTGILKFPRLLPALGIQHRSLPMYQISAIHDWSGIIMAALVLIHLALHWNWRVCMTKSFLKKGKEKKCER